MVAIEKITKLLDEIRQAATREDLESLLFKIGKEVDDGFQLAMVSMFVALKDHDLRLDALERLVKQIKT